MKTFFKDIRDIETSYDNIIDELDSTAPVVVDLVEKDIVLYYLNLIKALCNDIDITLLDSDFTENELKIVNEGVCNSITIVPQNSTFNDWEDVRNKIINSKSKVTIFTSGTTGQPRRVQHTVQSLAREVRQGSKHRESIWGFSYNPSHMAGLQVLFQAILNQNTIIDLYKLSKERVLERIQSNSISNISATPTFYRLLFPCDESYNTVTKISIGGEKSDESLLESLKKTFPMAKINNIYASTEAGTVLSSNGEHFYISKERCHYIKIEDNELMVHRLLLADFGEHKLKGWYRTGDMVEWVDEDKRTFKFVSRKNIMINTGGFKVNPIEVEEALRGIRGINDAYVFGKKNTVLGNILCAEVCIQENTEITESEIKQKLAKSLQAFKIPRKFTFSESLELSRTGKVKRI